MKKIILFIIADLFLSIWLYAEPGEWEIPHIIGINKEPGHATFIPYQDEATALQFDRNASTYFQLLNGEWKFSKLVWTNPWPLTPDSLPRPEDWQNPDR